MADVFTRMLIKAVEHNLIAGLMNDSINGGVISLQYADDTILFLENNVDKARHFKWILACYENLSGTKINYEKSDLMTIGLEEEGINLYARLFCCKIGSFPLKYLGIPLHYAKLM